MRYKPATRSELHCPLQLNALCFLPQIERSQNYLPPTVFESSENSVPIRPLPLYNLLLRIGTQQQPLWALKSRSDRLTDTKRSRMASSGVALDDVPTVDIMTELLRRFKCSSQPDKCLILVGHSVKDDIFIILGVSKVDTDPTKHNSEVKHAMIKLLRNELELEVLLVGPRNAHYESDLELEESGMFD